MRELEKFVAKTYAGLEKILQDELVRLGAQNCRIGKRAVEFEGDFALLYRANYFCRFALRILWQVRYFSFRDNKQFYEEVYKYPAERIMSPDNTLAISVTMTGDSFKTPLFAAQLAKDAICDRFREKYDRRPSVDKDFPDVQFHLHIVNNNAVLFLDASGESLHKRGYRVASHPAQISEVIAAAMLELSGWNADCDLIDPMCGSGTILIEGAMRALNIPAGFFRQDYGFFHWSNFNAKLWEQISNEADIREDVPINFYGSDISSRFLDAAQRNIEAARLDDFVQLERCGFASSEPKGTPAFLVFNPPYGERLSVDDIEQFYQEIGDTLKQKYSDCTAFIISSNVDAMKKIGLHPFRKCTLYNGPLECKFMGFQMYKGKLSSQ